MDTLTTLTGVKLYGQVVLVGNVKSNRPINPNKYEHETKLLEVTAGTTVEDGHDSLHETVRHSVRVTVTEIKITAVEPVHKTENR